MSDTKPAQQPAAKPAEKPSEKEQNATLARLAKQGVSIWLDDLSRERLTTGTLAALIGTDSVSGVTTNPTIFAAALSHGEAYETQLTELKKQPLADVIQALTTTDVRNACDVFAETYAASDGVDGRVSIEVEPGLARDTEGTVQQATQLHDVVARDNVLIKIPATKEGLPAIRRTLAAGTSVNVTLIFSVERYLEVIDAYMSGLEDADKAGLDLSTIHSVASFFVSRVDSEVDKRLDAIGTDEATALKGKAGIANARVAYGEFLKSIDSDRWRALAEKGAHPQRPLWASTGVKNPDYDDTMYVIELVAENCVNTMPEKTMQAVADHGRVLGDTITPHIDDAIGVMGKLQEVGVDMDDVTRVLEDEGVDKFVASWTELVETVQKALDA